MPRTARFADLDAPTLYALLRLRVDVFVVEQECAYPELDGRDTDPTTRHVWLGDADGAPLAYLRVLREPEGARIGRVVTAPAARGRGLAARLLVAALDELPGEVVRLAAQTHATGLYEWHGFTPDGPEFLEDGIAHLPMIRRVPR
ncbi:GNAT family N-acetyltransferase [Spiractinospora alimapuensis]|nr:GNAT family N-acetyltransferase [Spiractinospora alimapuensis]